VDRTKDGIALIGILYFFISVMGSGPWAAEGLNPVAAMNPQIMSSKMYRITPSQIIGNDGTELLRPSDN